MSNFIAGSKVEADSKKVYGDKKRCEVREGEACYLLPSGYQTETHKLVDGEIVEDAAKKAAYDAAQLQAEQDRQGLAGRQDAIDHDSLTTAQKRRILNRMIKDYLKRKNFDPRDI
ncbi:MAG: hypothetical protein ACPG5Z_00200 [Pseudoalteromonas sp.]